MADCKWIVRRVGDHFEGTIVFPAGVAPIRVTTKGRTKGEAIARAATAAKAIATNPLLSAVLPPGTGLAVAAVAELASSKNVRETLTKYTGDGARRLAAALGF